VAVNHRSWSVILIRLGLAIAAAALFVLVSYPRGETVFPASPFCGPLTLLKPWSSLDKAIGATLTVILLPLIFAPVVRTNRATIRLAIGAVLAWFVLGYLIALVVNN
jgi:hypothetical protein